MIYLYLKRKKHPKEAVEPVHEHVVTPEPKAVQPKAVDKKKRTILNYSFRSRLHLTPLEAFDRYETVRNKLLQYEDVKSNETWKYERYTYKNHSIVKVKLQGKTMRLFFGLEPSEITDEKYRIQDQSAVKMHENTPSMLIVKGPRGVKHALELIDMWVNKYDLKEKENYSYEPLKFKRLDKIALIRQRLIKTNDVEFLEVLEREEQLKAQQDT